jgi:hypothetical protein
MSVSILSLAARSVKASTSGADQQQEPSVKHDGLAGDPRHVELC